MRTKSPNKRSRHVPVLQQERYRTDAETNMETAQYFQISVNVIEARKLAWLNPHLATSYVIVVLGKKKRRTGIRRHMLEPCYRECFMFEQYASVKDLQKMNMWMAVMEPRCCAPPRVLGESTIDLAAVWAQPYHQVFHKWAQLALPQNSSAGAVGFLKLDISIIFRGDVQLMPVVVNELKAEDNLLLLCGSDQQPANYVITIYGAFGLSSGIQIHSDRQYGKPPSSFVRVTFCGISAKTAIQHRTNHPTYCEQVSIVEMFPNMSDLIKLEVCSAEGYFHKVLAIATLKLGHISHDGENGFLPTFGPSLLHMYGTAMSGSQTSVCDEGPYHRGAMLVSLKTFVPHYQQPLKSICVEPVMPVKPKHLWLLEDFYILCPVLEVSMLDRYVVGKQSGVAMTIGELPTDDQGDEEFVAMMSEIKSHKFYYTGSLDVLKTIPVYGYLNFPKAFPVLQLATRLPDFRFRMYRNNMINAIVSYLEQTISKVEYRLCKCDYHLPCELMDELNRGIDDTAGKLIKYLDIIQYSTSVDSVSEVSQKYSTELDQKQVALQKEEIEKIYQQLAKRAKCASTMNLIRSVMNTSESTTSAKKELKVALAEVKILTQSLKSLIFKTADGWPDIVIWLLNGGSRVAYHKIPAADIIYSVIPEQNGKHCGQIQTIYLRPLKCSKHSNAISTTCYCIAGKIELILWMGLFRQMHAFQDCLPKGYVLKSRCFDMCVKTSTLMLECRVFVYKAKLRIDVNPSHQMCPFVRVNVINTVKETDVRQKTCSPVWNQVIKIQRLVYATQERVSKSPPTVLVEICDRDVHTGKSELIGRVEAHPCLEDRTNYEYAPKLHWYNIMKGPEQTGQVLMSVQIIQIPETLMKNTMYCPIEETYVVPGISQLLTADSDTKESLPKHLIPKFSTYKVDIYWWGLRDVNGARRPCVLLEIDDLVIKSDIIVDQKINCNFPNGRMSQTFEAPMQEDYSPPLNIRLYDNSTFGRTLFLGSNVVRNPSKYIVSWLPKSEREESLRSVSITSSNFRQARDMLYVKNSSLSTIDTGSVNSKSTGFPSKTQRSSWIRIFSRRKPTEEECYLLPLFTKEKNQIKVVKKCSKTPECKDWWMRYYSSQRSAVGDTSSVDKIVIYNSELESQPEFSKFKDWCSTLKLYNGNKTGIPEKDDQLYCGFLKAGIAIYSWPPEFDTVAVSYNGVELNYGYFNDYPNNEPSKFLIRVYVVKATDLIPKEFTGRLDSYVVISCGNKHLGDRKSYIPNNLNPVFGRMYEFRCTLPEDYLLTVSLFDYDARPPDDIIGATTIDLEDRIYSKHRALVGLSQEYSLNGPAKWRDNLKPSSILEEVCVKNHIPPPKFSDNATVVVNGVEYTEGGSKSYTSATDQKENICLSLLRKWQTLPICGYHLVPEHVETRTLFSQEKPGMEQGKLQLWVDIFPLDADMYIPPPVDITPRQLENYELRVIVWDIQGLKIDNQCIKMSSDIYVRAWIGDTDQVQNTDIHYSSLSGDRSFNWRMIFHFQYQTAEKKMVKIEKNAFTEFEERVDPILIVQVMDSSASSEDDFLAYLMLNLNDMPRGTKQAHRCSLEISKKLDLFSTISTRGWWPLVISDVSTDTKVFAGVIDLELTLLTKEKAILMPVGLGREPPAPLPEPKRKDFSKVISCWNISRDTLYTIAGLTFFLIVLFLICFYLNASVPVVFMDEE